MGLKEKLDAGIRNVQRKMRGLSRTMQSVGGSMAAVGIGMGAALVPALAQYARFDDAMAKVSAITRATGEDLLELRNKAKELGATTIHSASAAAEGMTYLGMAGLSTKEILASIGPVLSLATAGALELAEAADIASDVAGAFGLPAKEIGMVADVLAATATAANTDVRMMGEAFKYAAPLAAAAGVPIHEVAAALGVLGNNGIKATVAGTDLAGMFKTLASGTGMNKFKSLGIDIATADGKLRPMVDLMRDFGAATSSMTDVDRLAKADEIFGRYAKSALILSSQTGSLASLTNQIENSEGAAAKMAATMQTGFGARLKGMLSAIQAVAIEIGEAFDGAFGKVLASLTNSVRGLAGWIAENKTLVASVIAAGVAIGILGGGLLSLGVSIAIASVAIGGLTTVTSIAAGAFGIITGALNAARIGVTAAIASWQIASMTMTTTNIAARALGAGVIFSQAAFASSPQSVQMFVGALGRVFGVLKTVTMAVYTWGSSMTLAGVKSAYLAVQTRLLAAANIAFTGVCATLAFAINTVTTLMSIQKVKAAALAAWLTVSTGAWSALTFAQGLCAAASAATGAAWTALTAPGAIVGALTTGLAVGFTAMWSALTVGVAPVMGAIAVVIAAIAGVAVVIGVVAGGAAVFADAWEYAKSVLKGFWAIAQETFGGIKNALKAGDYMAAAKILWAGVKVAFWAGTKEVMRVFENLWTTLWDSTKKFFTTFVSTVWNVFKSIPKMLSAALSGGSLGDIIGGALGDADFSISGVVDKKLGDARTELKALNAEAAGMIDQQDKQEQAKEKQANDKAMKQAGLNPDGTPLNTGAVGASGSDSAETPDGQSALQSRIDSLKEEIVTLQYGSEAADRWKLAQQGATAEQLVYVQRLQEQKRKLAEQKDNVVDSIRSFGDELADAGRTPLEVIAAQVGKLNQAVRDGKLSMEDARNEMTNLRQDRDTRESDLKNDAEELRKSLRSPLEVAKEAFAEDKRKIDQLAEAGKISAETEARARADAQEKFRKALTGDAPQNTGPGSNNVALRGSEAAARAIRRFEDQGRSDGVVNQARAFQRRTQEAVAPGRFTAKPNGPAGNATDLRPLERLTNAQLIEAKKLPALLVKIAENTKAGSAETVAI